MNFSDSLRRQLEIAFFVLVTLKIALLFIFAWHGRFVMDEFAQLGWAKYLGNGLFDTIWHAKAVGYAVFYKLAHLIGWNAVSILLIGRIQTALLACGTIAIVYGCARAIGNDRTRSLAIVLVLLCFSNFIERSFRTIAEPLALFFASAALLVLLRGKADRPRTLFLAGILGGLSFLATQKAAYFDAALGLALVGDAFVARRYVAGIARGAWLVFGWVAAVAAYCFAFGGTDPVPILQNLIFGPVEVATKGADAYSGSLRVYVEQTLLRNFVLYIFCFTGIALSLLRIREMGEPPRIALIFSVVVTSLVFAHNQPWPYVFIMALPFMALWSTVLFDRLGTTTLYGRVAMLVLGIAIVGSFIRNAQFLEIDNRAQLDLVARAEALVGEDEIYFDGVAMLPNRKEPSTLWLDRAYVLKTLQDGNDSEAFRIIDTSSPKAILWTYRMEAIEPVVGELIESRYVRVSPNIRLAGRQLERSKPTTFYVPFEAHFALYGTNGEPLNGKIEVNGQLFDGNLHLARGQKTLTLYGDNATALLLPVGSYDGLLASGLDDRSLFDHVYN